MKNLKKALSLVLASAMLIGMMVVGTGAAHSDVKAEHNVEAIGVVSAAGIMGAGEEFNPDANITRNEMAVVMVNMLDLDTKAFAGASSFTDVPAWAADYVDACFANGIVSGTSATTYNGAANVKTVEATLMVLKALGYFEKQPINDFMLDTIRKAAEIELLDGIDAKADAYMTRNEVAQLVFNALNTNWVKENASGNTTSIKGENLSIEIGAVVNAVDQKETLMDKLFDGRFVKLPADEAFDDFGLPATIWVDTENDDEEIVCVTKAADKVIIAEESYEDDAVTAYQEQVNEKFDDEKYTVNFDGDIVAGDVVYFYAVKDEDGKKTGDFDAYVVNYVVAEVTDIEDEDIALDDEKDGVKAYITLDDAIEVKDIDFAGFDYEKDDFVLVVMSENEDGEPIVLASEKVESFEGKITAINKKGQVKIAGDYYTVADTYADVDAEIDVKAEWFLNKAGQIFMAGDASIEKSEDYAVIYNVVDVTDDEEQKNDDGYAVVDGDKYYEIYAVLADGSKAKFNYFFDESEDDEDEMADLVGEQFIVTAYSYEDGQFAFETAKYDIAEGEADFENVKYVEVEGKNKYADSKTEFVFVMKNEDDNKLDVETKTGLKNVDYAGDVVVVYEKTAIKYVFVNEIVEEVADAEYAVLADNAVASEKVEKKTVYTIETADGVIKTKNVDVADAFAELAVGTIFSYTLTDGFVAEVEDITVVADVVAEYDDVVKVEMVGEDFYVIDGEEYVTNDKTVIKNIAITMDENDDEEFEVDTLKVTDGELKKDAKVIIADTKVDDDETIIKVAFIVKVRY